MSPPSSFRIRPAHPADVPSILPMVRAHCDLHRSWDPERFPIRDDVERLYADWLPRRAADPRSVVLVAERSSAGPSDLCGFIVGTIEQNIRIYTLAEFGYLHDLWVQPDARGMGVGGALLNAALDALRSKGVRQVRGETAAANDAARLLMARHGFRVGAVEVMCPLEQPR